MKINKQKNNEEGSEGIDIGKGKRLENEKKRTVLD